MATWRKVKTGQFNDYFVSTEGKSARINYWARHIRYDTAKGWIDLAFDSVHDEHDSLCRVWLPVPQQSSWRRVDDDAGEPVTEEDIAQIRIDIEAALTAGGDRCSFLDDAYIYGRMAAAD